MAAITVRLISLFSSEKEPTVMSVSWKQATTARHAVDQLEAEPQVNQHARQRIQGRHAWPGAQLRAHLRTDDLDVPHREIGSVEVLLQAADHRLPAPRRAARRANSSTPPRCLLRKSSICCAICVVALGASVPRCNGSFGSRYCARLRRPVLFRSCLSCVAADSAFQRIDDGVLALVERRFAGFLHAPAQPALRCWPGAPKR